MPVSEMNTFNEYSRKHGLPFDRLEIQLARLCMMMDAYMGGKKNVKLNDYLIRNRVENESELSDNEDDLKAYFGFNPINVEE